MGGIGLLMRQRLNLARSAAVISSARAGRSYHSDAAPHYGGLGETGL